MNTNYIKHKRYWKVAAMFLISLMNCIAINKSCAQQSMIWSKEMQAIIKPSSTEGFLEFKDETNINPLTLFSDYKNLFIPGADDEMHLYKTENDNIGMTHYRYQQYYKGIKIKGAEYNVHAHDGRCVSANGKLVEGILSRTVNPSLTEEIALREALNTVPGKKYMWLNEKLEARLKEDEKDINATYYPHGELMLVKPRGEKTFIASALILCWVFDINVESGLSKTVFIDANNGTIVNTLPLDINCILGNGTTTWNGTQNVWTKLSGSNYIMYEDCGITIRVRNANAKHDLTNVTEYTDADNVWTGLTKEAVTQTYIGLRTSYLYYYNIFGRDSYNNAGAAIYGYNNAYFEDADTTQPDYPDNAGWSNNGHYISFGPGQTSAPEDDWNSDDIVGHEFTHGVTQYSAGLDYQDESGALNESFSDIFGEMVEKYLEGTTDWLCGNDRTGGYIRNFADPYDTGQPGWYLGNNWYFGTADHGGVHTNSGVQNRFFYRLSEGDSLYNITGIGADAAASIAYRTLTVYLTSTSEYIDSRAAWIHSAIDLFGSCSNEAIATGEAWRSVGVGDQNSQYNNEVCGTYPSGSSVTLQGIQSITGAPGCSNTIVPAIYTVQYKAAFYVELQPGFMAQSGSHFTAFLNLCNITLYRPSNLLLSENAVPQGASMERLSEINNDGFFAEVLPNPFSEKLTIRYNLADAGTIKINVYDLPGNKVMDEQTADGVKGANELTIYTVALKPGVYLAEIACINYKITRKIVKVE